MRTTLNVLAIIIMVNALSSCFAAAVGAAAGAGGYIAGKENAKEEPEDKVIKKSE